MKIRIPGIDSDLGLYCAQNIAKDYATHGHVVESLYMPIVEQRGDLLHMCIIALEISLILCYKSKTIC